MNLLFDYECHNMNIKPLLIIILSLQKRREKKKQEKEQELLNTTNGAGGDGRHDTPNGVVRSVNPLVLNPAQMIFGLTTSNMSMVFSFVLLRF